MPCITEICNSIGADTAGGGCLLFNGIVRLGPTLNIIMTSEYQIFEKWCYGLRLMETKWIELLGVLWTDDIEAMSSVYRSEQMCSFMWFCFPKWKAKKNWMKLPEFF